MTTCYPTTTQHFFLSYAAILFWTILLRTTSAKPSGN